MIWNYSHNRISSGKLKSVVTLIAWFCMLNIGWAQVSSLEKEALLEFNKSLNGDHWKRKWNLNEPVEKWYGVQVRDDKVVGIQLFQNNLMGPLPNSIGKLVHLETLNLAFNQITGELPSEISALKSLKVLKLEMNRLKGELPQQIENLSELNELSVFNNFIGGRIPEGITELKNLKVLNLSSNHFFGRIPDSIGALSQLEILGLFENQLYGDIPEGMGKLSALKELVLANNQLGGIIPESIGGLASLQILQIQNNKFDSFKNLAQLDHKGMLVFDFDGDKRELEFNDMEFSRTRMADTKFEDDVEHD